MRKVDSQFIDAYFHGYKTEKAVLSELMFKYEELQKSVYGIRSPATISIRSTGFGSRDDMLAESMTQLDALKAKIDRQRQKVDKLEEKHLKDIAKVDNVKNQSVLRLYYISDMKVYSIADYLECSEDHVYKMLRAARKELYNVL